MESFRRSTVTLAADIGPNDGSKGDLAMTMTHDDETNTVIGWLEANLGKVRTISRQTRWRPVWIVDVETDHELLPLMVRGDRSDTEYTWSLPQEMAFQKVMVEHGVKGPRTFGWLDKPRAFVTERLPGKSDFDGVEEADRHRIVDEYVADLVRLHSLDVTPFIEAGIDAPSTAGNGLNPATLGMYRMEQMFRRQNIHADPFVEYFLGWWNRNRPKSCDRQGAVVWDSGQFMHLNGHYVGIIDVELGHIGDPMMDLAGWRMRDSIMHFGDFGQIYSRYSELAGSEVDLDAIQLHHVAFTLSNQLAFSHCLLDPPPMSDFATNLQWCNETNLYVTEALAEYLGVELPTVEIPEPRPSTASAAFAHLVQLLRNVTTDDDYLQYRLRGAFRVARHLTRHDEIGAAVLDANLVDVHQLIGRRLENWPEAEEAVKQFVVERNADGSNDELLCQHFHRRNLRLQMLGGPAGSAMARHIPIQRFRP